jgi:hypothetical protein
MVITCSPASSKISIGIKTNYVNPSNFLLPKMVPAVIVGVSSLISLKLKYNYMVPPLKSAPMVLKSTLPMFLLAATLRSNSLETGAAVVAR